jgi:hypothetical protein
MRALLFLSTFLAGCAVEIPTAPSTDPGLSDDPVSAGTGVAAVRPTSEVSAAAGEASAPATATQAPTTGTVLSAVYDRITADGLQLITVTATLTSNGLPVRGAAVTVTTVDGVYSAVTEISPGRYLAYVLPFAPSGHVRLVTSGGGKVVTHTALMLPQLGDRWGLAEPVPGLVNTPGYEDSAEVSPDGEWLLVADYSPVDMICCLYGTCVSPPVPRKIGRAHV